MISLIEKNNSRKFTLPVLFGLETPFKNWEPSKILKLFMLQEIHIMAVKKSRRSSITRRFAKRKRKPGPYNGTRHMTKSPDLKQALQVPKNVKVPCPYEPRVYTSFPMDILKLTNLEFLDLESNRLKDLA